VGYEHGLGLGWNVWSIDFGEHLARRLGLHHGLSGVQCPEDEADIVVVRVAMRQEVVRNVCLPAAADSGQATQLNDPPSCVVLEPKFRWSVAFRFPRQHADLVVEALPSANR